MKAILLLLKDDTVHKCIDKGDYVNADISCPKCGGAPVALRGTDMRPSADDSAWEANGRCLACKAHIGTIRVEMTTLFGVREDQAVLGGVWKVY